MVGDGIGMARLRSMVRGKGLAAGWVKGLHARVKVG